MTAALVGLWALLARAPSEPAVPVVSAAAAGSVAALVTDAAPPDSASSAATGGWMVPTGEPSPLEAWGASVVAAQQDRLRVCMERDRAANPEAASEYTVTLFVQADGHPKNGHTTFWPPASEGFIRCARRALADGFTPERIRARPATEAFPFSTTFALPDAGTP